MPETTEGERPNGPSEEVPFHYVLTLQYTRADHTTDTGTKDGIAFIRPGHSRAAVYTFIVDEFLNTLEPEPDSVAVLFFELSPERLAA